VIVTTNIPLNGIAEWRETAEGMLVTLA